SDNCLLGTLPADLVSCIVFSKLFIISSYRSRFISQSAKQIVAASNGTPDEWIDKLTKLTYEDARQQLMSLPGIGAKVADCICLMSLNHTEAIPVDTHVYQITVK